MAKGGLSNSLLGKTVTPAFTDRDVICPHVGGSTYSPDMHPCWPKNFQPNYSGECTAKIEAAWTSDDKIIVAIVDPHGNCGEAYLNHLKIRQG